MDEEIRRECKKNFDEDEQSRIVEKISKEE